MKYTFRPCTLNDFELLFKLKKENFKYYIEKCWGWNEEDQINRLKFDLEENINEKQIILVNNEGIGVYVAKMTENGDMFIAEINILKEYQGRGIGTDILRKQLEENKEKGIRTTLRVFKDNPAKNLYERLGFKVYEEIETHYLMGKI